MFCYNPPCPNQKFRHIFYNYCSSEFLTVIHYVLKLCNFSVQCPTANVFRNFKRWNTIRCCTKKKTSRTFEKPFQYSTSSTSHKSAIVRHQQVTNLPDLGLSCLLHWGNYVISIFLLFVSISTLCGYKIWEVLTRNIRETFQHSLLFQVYRHVVTVKCVVCRMYINTGHFTPNPLPISQNL